MCERVAISRTGDGDPQTLRTRFNHGPEVCAVVEITGDCAKDVAASRVADHIGQTLVESRLTPLIKLNIGNKRVFPSDLVDDFLKCFQIHQSGIAARRFARRSRAADATQVAEAGDFHDIVAGPERTVRQITRSLYKSD